MTLHIIWTFTMFWFAATLYDTILDMREHQLVDWKASLLWAIYPASVMTMLYLILKDLF